MENFGLVWKQIWICSLLWSQIIKHNQVLLFSISRPDYVTFSCVAYKYIVLRLTLRISYLWKFWLLLEGLKLHVDDVVRPNDGKSVGEFLLVAFAKISASFGVGLIANGDLATLPGVILGSSSMLFICEPLN